MGSSATPGVYGDTSFTTQDSRMATALIPFTVHSVPSEVADSVEHQPPGLRGRQHPPLLLRGHKKLHFLLLCATGIAVTL